ncbi:MAG: polyketide synthase dehydratase domain-containing protein, partial [Candidatus Competibacteraceae bacterium]|nr:polyketide synthase dehydratase domain-containing protein [Candidatus Competibacteraceae bacterium]
YAKATLPTYPFQRQRYWPDLAPATKASTRSWHRSDELSPPIHPLLARRLRLPQSAESRFETWMTVDRLPFLSDHQVYGMPVFPAAGFLEMALAAGHELLPGTVEIPPNPPLTKGGTVGIPLAKGGIGTIQVEDLDLLAPLRLDENAGTWIQLLAIPSPDETLAIHIFHCADEAAPVKLVSGRLRRMGALPSATPVDLESLCQQWTQAPVADFYAGF